MNIIDIAIAKQLAGGGGGSGTDSYNDLSNLPKINDVTLSGNKSSSALGLQSEITSDSKLASDLVDDTNQDNKFVTSAEKTTWNGKQNAIDADHKINADYVDDSTSTNKFVTASDKETWNAKQNAIDNSHKLSSDLVDDANHTNKFVTSTEKQTWNAKQNAIDADHKLSSSLVSFSEAEAAAIASGIDSSKVGQISTNQTNILYGLNRNAKNLIDFKFNDTPTTGTGYYWDTACDLPAGTYSISFLLTSTAQVGLYVTVDGSDISKFLQTGTKVSHEYTFTANSAITRVRFWINGGDNIIYDFMISLKDVYDADPTYESYSAPNYDLTYLEAEDRAALAEEIDAGAKNKLKNNSYTCTGSQGRYGRDDSLSIPAGDYVLIAKLNQAQNAALTLVWDGNQHDFNAYGSLSNTIKTWNVHATNTITSAWVYFNGTNDTWTEVMLCTKATFGVSSKFVPYRPNYDLVCGNALGYTITQTSTSFNNVLADAMKSYYFKNEYDTHTGMLFVSTEVTNEYCVAYFSIDRAQSITIVKLSNNVIDITAYNNAGSIVLSGGTAPYTLTVKYNN